MAGFCRHGDERRHPKVAGSFTEEHEGLAGWCYGTRSSCRYRAVRSVPSIFFLGGLYAFFHVLILFC